MQNAAIGVPGQGGLESMTPHKSSESEGHGQRVEDLRPVTLINRNKESWVTTVRRFCETVLRLGVEATARIVQSCQENAAEAFLYECMSVPSVCFHHKVALSDGIPLHYKVLCLKAQIQEEDLDLFASITPEAFTTREEQAQLLGFAGLQGGAGAIIREWAWKAPADVAEAPGMSKQGILMQEENQRIGALLIGIEGSAPMKDDLFGNTHSPDATSKGVSAWGKRKWRDYRSGGQDVPADLGGLRVVLNKSRFQQLQELCEGLDLASPSEPPQQGSLQDAEKELFRSLLVSSDDGIKKIFEERLQITRGIPEKRCGGVEKSAFWEEIGLQEGLSSIFAD